MHVVGVDRQESVGGGVRAFQGAVLIEFQALAGLEGIGNMRPLADLQLGPEPLQGAGRRAIGVRQPDVMRGGHLVGARIDHFDEKARIVGGRALGDNIMVGVADRGRGVDPVFQGEFVGRVVGVDGRAIGHRHLVIDAIEGQRARRAADAKRHRHVIDGGDVDGDGLGHDAAGAVGNLNREAVGAEVVLGRGVDEAAAGLVDRDAAAIGRVRRRRHIAERVLVVPIIGDDGTGDGGVFVGGQSATGNPGIGGILDAGKIGQRVGCRSAGDEAAVGGQAGQGDAAAKLDFHVGLAGAAAVDLEDAGGLNEAHFRVVAAGERGVADEGKLAVDHAVERDLVTGGVEVGDAVAAGARRRVPPGRIAKDIGAGAAFQPVAAAAAADGVVAGAADDGVGTGAGDAGVAEQLNGVDVVPAGGLGMDAGAPHQIVGGVKRQRQLPDLAIFQVVNAGPHRVIAAVHIQQVDLIDEAGLKGLENFHAGGVDGRIKGDFQPFGIASVGQRRPGGFEVLVGEDIGGAGRLHGAPSVAAGANDRLRTGRRGGRPLAIGTAVQGHRVDLLKAAGLSVDAGALNQITGGGEGQVQLAELAIGQVVGAAPDRVIDAVGIQQIDLIDEAAFVGLVNGQAAGVNGRGVGDFQPFGIATVR